MLPIPNQRPQGVIAARRVTAAEVRATADFFAGTAFSPRPGRPAGLFENARRYGRHGESEPAEVLVSETRQGGGVTLTVRDYGPGVDPRRLNQIATPFYRGDSARTAATGAGLGLAIVDKAVQRMGGQFEVANAMDGGFMVNIRLKKAA